MKKGLFNKRIPTLIALFILVIIVGISTILIQSGIFYVGKAAPDTQPLNFHITNVGDTSFTVAFTTTGQVDSIVTLKSSTPGNTIILDDRDKKSGAQNKYYSHHITVPNLKPETEYKFDLIVGGKQYSDPSYLTKTLNATSTSPPSQNPVFGKIQLPDGTTGNDTIVTLKTPTSRLASAISDVKGEFILPTNSLRNESSGYEPLQNDTPLTLEFFRQTMTARVNTTFLISQNLPSVTLLEQYTFVGSPQDSVPNDNSQLTFVTDEPSAETVSIQKPQEGEEFVDQRPSFSGTSYPNSSVNLSIPGVAQQQLLTRADGLWTFQPKNNIPPGNHTVTISVTGNNTEDTSVTRKFTVFPLGSQISDESGQSLVRTAALTGTPTLPPPTPTPTLFPSPTIATTPIASPTVILSPTLAVTMTPTPTSLPTIYFTPTNTPTINPPGAFQSTALLTAFSVVLIVAGVALLFAL